MKKKLFIACVLVFSIGIVDVSAQNFLNKLKKTVKKGVTKPEQPGSLYAWGELATKTNFVSENNKTYHKDMDDISGNAAYDLATAKWGKGWRMPTKAEYDKPIRPVTK